MTKQRPIHEVEDDGTNIATSEQRLTPTPETCDSGSVIHRPDNERPREDAQSDRREKPSFPIGRLVATPGAIEALAHMDIVKSLQRHLSGDWGDVDDEDRAANDRALIEGTRLLSSYKAENGTKFWIITEADRSATTVLLPSEY